MATAPVAAKHICISVTRFRDLVAAGTITKAPSGRYSLDQVREEYILNLQAVASGRGVDHAGLTQQRAKLEAARAGMVEHKLAVMRGDFVSLDLVEKKLNPLFLNFREQALSTPGVIADAVSQACGGDRTLVYSIIDDRLREMLNDLADGKSAAVSELRPSGRREGADIEEQPA